MLLLLTVTTNTSEKRILPSNNSETFCSQTKFKGHEISGLYVVIILYNGSLPGTSVISVEYGINYILLFTNKNKFSILR